MSDVRILSLYLSPGHNFFGHHGQAAGEYPVLQREEISCIERRGVEGDRFFDYKPDYKGQITFFAHEVYEELCGKFGIRGRSAGAFRRNVITAGVDLNGLIGREFEIQGIRFLGTGECKPCYWMDEAFHPGAESALQGRGGLRAKILSSGILRTSALRRVCAHP